MGDAHEQIRNLLGRYGELIDAADFEGLADLFGEATLAGPDGTIFARTRAEQIHTWAGTMRLYDGVPRTRHLTTNSIIEVDEPAGTATSRSVYVVLQATDRLPLQPVITGRYHDKFARRDNGVWSFTQRRYFVDQLGELSHHLTSSRPKGLPH